MARKKTWYSAIHYRPCPHCGWIAVGFGTKQAVAEQQSQVRLDDHLKQWHTQGQKQEPIGAL